MYLVIIPEQFFKKNKKEFNYIDIFNDNSFGADRNWSCPDTLNTHEQVA